MSEKYTTTYQRLSIGEPQENEAFPDGNDHRYDGHQNESSPAVGLPIVDTIEIIGEKYDYYVLRVICGFF